MTGAYLLSTACCRASHTVYVRWPVQVSVPTRPAYTKMRLAFLATPPDHSRSRSDSPSSPGQRVELELLGYSTYWGVIAAKPAALRKLLRSRALTLDCPMIAIVWPVPLVPAL